MTRPTQPRIPPIDLADLTDSQRELLSAGSSHVLQTLARHEALLKAWLGLGQQLLFSERVTPRERELAILRVALRTRCEYEWANHVLGALAARVTAAEIHALSDPAAAWPESETALLHAVDDLCANDCVSDATWTELQATRSDVQLIELVCLLGYYRMNAGMLNSLGVQPETGRPRMGEVPEYAVRLSDLASAGSGTGSVDGSWQVVMEHPAGNQNLILELHCSDATLAGSVVNPALGVTLKIVDGSVDGSTFRFRAPLEKPVAVDLAYRGVVHGDAIDGEVSIQGGGTFPFKGTRTESS